MNQCDGCKSGQPIWGGLHRDSMGRATMACEAAKYDRAIALLDSLMDEVNAQSGAKDQYADWEEYETIAQDLRRLLVERASK